MAFRSEPAQNIRRQARLFGMKSLYEDALDKAVLGVTTIPEAMHLFTGH
jgi:type IV pilus assembly protein PilB